jgi:predicted MFS family arabinose efflux permease
VAGVIDIVLFTWVHEPPNELVRNTHPLDTFLEPLRHREFRTFVLFSCMFSASAMLAASFMQIFVLGELGVPRWQVNLIWCMQGVGGVTVARMWGRLADRHGQRPVLLICIIFKPLVCIAFFLATPGNAFVMLLIVLLFDSMLNAGYVLAANGYQMRMAPKRNRSMFVAATMALAGVAGGIGSIVGGLFLKNTQAFHLHLAGRDWNHYHLLFLLSFVMRALCIPLAAAIKEPDSSATAHVVSYLRGLWPMRMLLFPVGLYKRRPSSLRWRT